MKYIDKGSITPLVQVMWGVFFLSYAISWPSVSSPPKSRTQELCQSWKPAVVIQPQASFISHGSEGSVCAVQEYRHMKAEEAAKLAGKPAH